MSNEITPVTALRIAAIHTSDRISFKRCRRKWNWSSKLRGFMEMKVQPGPLWMGSGMHFALEDFHGYNNYGSATRAFAAYVHAWKVMGRNRMPDDHMELTVLCDGMMQYYDTWLRHRNPLKTFWHNGVPQCEVTFEIPLPVDFTAVDMKGVAYEDVRYVGTIDRVAIDEHGRLWLIDYKSAKMFSTSHYDTDPQVTAYCWAASVLYPDHEVAGFIYQQHLKELAKPPETLKSGKLSLNKSQRTTRQLYREGLINLYGAIENAPPDYVTFLNELAASETQDEDRFIRRDWIERSVPQIEAEGEKIMLEVVDMLNPDLPLYPNPTRDCSWDCSFQSACLMIDDEGDFEGELKDIAVIRQPQNDSWRKYLPSPDTF